MKEKKRILIFNSLDSQEMSFAIKELYFGDADYLPILFAEHELRSFLQNVLAEKLYGDYSPVRSWWRRQKTKASTRDIDLAEFSATEFIQKNTPHKKMRDIFLKYRPNLIVCMARKAIEPAIAARKYMGLNTKLVVVVSDFILDRRVIKPDVDFYVVPTLAVKAEMKMMGIDEDKIEVIPILVRRMYLEDTDKAMATEQLGLNPDLPTVMLKATFSYNLKLRQLVTYLQKERLKMNILVACGYDKKLLSDIQDMASPIIVGRNEQLDMRLAYATADIVITRPRSEDIAMCIAKNKVVITYDCVGEIEERMASLISVDYSVDCQSKEEVLGTLLSYIDNKKAYMSNIPTPEITQCEAGEKLKALLNTLVI